MRIAYLFNSLLCCGGNRIAFEHVNRLAIRGHDAFAVDLTGRHDPSWFPFNDRVKIVNYLDYASWIPGLDAVVATYFRTVPDVLRVPDSVKKFYFVQTDERNFHDKGTRGELECENTYQHPAIHLFTEARWVKRWLERDYGREAVLVENGLNFEDIYPDPAPEMRGDRPVVLVEGNATAIKKGVRDAAAALEGMDVETWLLCNDDEGLPDYTQCFDRVFNLPPRAMIRKIISTADVILKPSHFEGCPLPHMEAMVCRTALISTDCTGADEHCRDGENSLIVPVGNVEAMRAAIECLIGDAALRDRLIDNAWRHAKTRFRWDPQIDILEDMFEDYKPVDTRSLQPDSIPDPLPGSVLEEMYEVVEPPPDPRPVEAGEAMFEAVISKVANLKGALSERNEVLEKLTLRIALLEQRLERRDTVRDALDRCAVLSERLDKIESEGFCAITSEMTEVRGQVCDVTARVADLSGPQGIEGLEERLFSSDAKLDRIDAYHGKFVRVARVMGIDRAIRGNRWIQRTLAHRATGEFLTPELISRDRMQQEFSAERPFDGVSLRLATHGRINDCTLRISIYAPERGGAPIREVTLQGCTIADNAHVQIPFDRVEPDGCERFRLSIESPDAIAGGGISAYASESENRRDRFRFNGTRIRGRLEIALLP